MVSVITNLKIGKDQKMDYFLKGSIVGLVIGLISGAWAMVFLLNLGFIGKQKAMIEECEKSLTRDKHCTLVAREIE